MKSEHSTHTAKPAQRRDQELDGRYGKIGIPAVAAAVRCQKFDTTAALPRERDGHVERAPRAA